MGLFNEFLWVCGICTGGTILWVAAKSSHAKRLKKEYDEALKKKDKTAIITKGRIYYAAFNDTQPDGSKITDIETRIMNDLKMYDIT